jgi:purine-binding chemotaxis protein CheW
MDAALRAVLEERARALARPAAPPKAAGALEAVTFFLTDERYAIESRYVIEVRRLTELALLPGAKPPVFGVTAWRGGPLAVLDLRPLLGVSATALNDLGHLVVLGEGRAAFGVLADGVGELVELSASEVHAPPAGVAVHREYLRGVTGDALLVLDAARLLAAHAA